jgi:hypothetical protein
MRIVQRIGALDVAAAIHERIGSYVHSELIEFVAVEAERVHCWYMNGGGEGPTFHIELVRQGSGWTMKLMEHPPGTEQNIEVP